MVRALGLMSGTSMDGIDLAMIETDGRDRVIAGPGASEAYSAEDRTLLQGAVTDAEHLTDRTVRSGRLGEAEAMITRRHIDLVQRFLKREGLSPAAIDVIGFHGQTVLHRPETGLTVQLGLGADLAAATGIPVVFDFRAADVAAGGQGAPLVPIFHKALVAAADLPRPIVLLNLGGVGNVTFVGEGDALLAFDTGPGNALIDDAVLASGHGVMDIDGRLALAGRVDDQSLARLMAHSYFQRRPPKSLDRNAFSRQAVSHLPLPDAVATLTAFTAQSVLAATRWFPEPPRSWVVCGGGARNPAIMKALQDCLPGAVHTADEMGWSSMMMEAQAFAYLAVRSVDGLPITFPATTGVGSPLRGGRLVRPSRQAA